MDEDEIDWSKRFSLVRVVLSDVLPPAAFHPDFEKSVLEKLTQEEEREQNHLDG